MNILLIDDSPQDREHIHQLLHQSLSSCNIIEVGQAQALAEALAQRNIDIVITELNLSWVDSLTVIQQVKEQNPQASVFIVTDLTGAEVVDQAFNAGASDFILKNNLFRLPVAIQQVTKRIALQQQIEQAQRQLQLSEERYRAVSELMADFAYEYQYDEQKGVVCKWIAGGFTQMTGYTVEELNATGWINLLHPADLPKMQERAALTQSGQTTSGEARIVTKSGEVRLVYSIRRPVFDDTGKVVGYIGASRDITATRRMEEHLSQREAYLRTIIDSEPACVKLVARDGSLLDMNPAGLELIEAESLEQVVGTSIYSLVNPEYHGVFGESLERAFNGQPTDLQFEITGLKGARRWMESHTAPLRLNGEEITAALAIALDKTAEKADAERQTAILNALPANIALLDREGVIVAVNQTWKDFAEANDYVGEPYGIGTNYLFVCEQAEAGEGEVRAITAGLHQVLKGERREFISEYACHSPQAKRWFQMIVSALPDNPGYGAVVMHINVTERVSAVEKLQQSEKSYRNLLDTAREGIWMIDVEARTTYVNQHMAEMLGYRIEEMVGCPLYDFMDDEAREEAEQKFERRRQAVREEHDFRFRHKNGSDVWALLATNPIQDENNHFVGALAMITDITDRKQAEVERHRLETQLFQAQRMESIGTLAGGVAHDFNNLLTAILGNTMLMKRALSNNPDMLDYLEDIESASHRAAKLTKQLLAFGRRQRLMRTNIDIGELVGGLSSILERIIGEDVRLTINNVPDLPKVYADPAQLEQVIMNLVVNARDAMPEGGLLTITTQAVSLGAAFCQEYPWASSGPYVLLTVNDTGCGMNIQTVEQIFEPFFTTKEVGKGTGLGLSVAYGIVKQHNGYILVDSVLGEGTVFSVYLPVSRIAGVPGSVTPGEFPTRISTGGSETVILAEDDELLRRFVHRMLADQGYRVYMASDGEEAVRLFTAHQDEVALLVFDMVMPLLSGPKAYERICQMGRKLPVVFMTGYSAEVARDRLKLDHHMTLLQKPDGLDRLCHEARKLLDRAILN